MQQLLKVTMRGFIFSTVMITLFFLCSPLASAHARWDPNGIVKPRDPSDLANLKSQPCGTNVRTATPATFTPGQVLEVTFQETVQHLSYFRIAFSPAGDTGFDNNVLSDKISDDQGTLTATPHLFRTTITLPMQTCDACTLQLIQVMVDNPNSPSNYYSCSDIKLVNGGGTTPTPTPVPTPMPTPVPTSTPTPSPALTNLKLIAQNLLDDFSVADIDKNSLLSLAEAQTILPGLALNIFTTLDSNLNGTLSKEELNLVINPPAANPTPTSTTKSSAASTEWITLLALLPFALRRLRKSRNRSIND